MICVFLYGKLPCMEKNYDAVYRKMTAWFRRDEKRIQFLQYANFFLTWIFYIGYPVLLVWILIIHPDKLMKCILVPGISFVILTMVRDRLNFARPYEDPWIHPLLHKETKGNSLPSRHVFSASVIAMTMLYFSVPMGLTAFVLCVFSGAVRVIGGVHYPRDAAAGLLCGIAAGLFLWL